MKTIKKTLFLASFLSLLIFNSCQEEQIEVFQSEDSETLAAESKLTELIGLASEKKGGADNIIDKSSCISVKLPVKVIANGKELEINSKQDFRKIRMIFKESKDDEDTLEIVYPIVVISKDHTETTVNSKEELKAVVAECKGGNNNDDNDDDDNDDDDNGDDDDNDDDNDNNTNNNGPIKCIEFNYPIKVSIYNTNFEVVNVLDIENDMQMHRLIKRIRHGNVLASINYPISMTLADSTEVVVNNNIELLKAIKEAKGSCNNDDDDDDDNDDDDNDDDDNDDDDDDDNNDNNNNNLTIERIEEQLQKCAWKIVRLSIDGAIGDNDYRGVPLKFLPNNVVKIKLNDDVKEGTYNVSEDGAKFILKIMVEGSPKISSEWKVVSLGHGFIKLENETSKMMLKKDCSNNPNPGNDNDNDNDTPGQDTDKATKFLTASTWEVAKYYNGLVNVQDPTAQFLKHTLNFEESGEVKVTDPNNATSAGAWEVNKMNGLHLKLEFASAPFSELNNKWRVKKITPRRVELLDLNADEGKKRILVLEKKM